MIDIKNYIFLGTPGVGKGTVAKIIAKNFNFKHLSTGEIFRENILNKTPLGIKVDALLKGGIYVPDEITNALVKSEIETLKKQNIGIIFDGYPRTIEQAEFLDSLIKIEQAIHLTISDELATKRLLGRNRRDDNINVIKDRLTLYKEKTLPLITYYEKQHKLTKVDFSGTVNMNVENMLEILKIKKD